MKKPRLICCGKCNVELTIKEMDNCQLVLVEGEMYKIKTSNGYLCALCYNDQLQKGGIKRTKDDDIWD